MSAAIGWPLVALLLAISFVVSGLETACLTIERARLRFESRRGSLKAMGLARIIDQREQLLVAILILNNACNVVAFALFAFMLGVQIGPWGYAVAFVVCVPFYIFWCELLPKSIFSHFPFRMLMRFVPLLKLLRFFSSPLGMLFPSLREPPPESTAALNRGRDAFRDQTDAIQRAGTLNPDETALIQHVLDFENVTARDLMSPLSRVTAIPSDMSLDLAIQLARDTNYDQFPVMSPKGDLVGQVRVVELLRAAKDNGNKVSDYLRDLPPIAPDEPAIKTLHLLRQFRVELAAVTNKNGRPLGIISSYDIVQALMHAE
ncbi:MAG: CNNM domain-containing protein [Verrucomicrobiota bacterium]